MFKVIAVIILIVALGCSAEPDPLTEQCERIRVNFIGLLQIYNNKVVRKIVPELVPDMLSILESNQITYAEFCYMTGPLPPVHIHPVSTI